MLPITTFNRQNTVKAARINPPIDRALSYFVDIERSKELTDFTRLIMDGNVFTLLQRWPVLLSLQVFFNLLERQLVAPYAMKYVG